MFVFTRWATIRATAKVSALGVIVRRRFFA
jgi:hypothetical protein